MNKLPLVLKSYILLVCGLAALALAGAWALFPEAGSVREVYFAVTLAVMIAAARRFPLQVAPKTKVVIDTAALGAVAIMLSPALAITAAAVGKAIGQGLTRGPWFQKAFNTAAAAVQVAAGAVTFHFLRSGSLIDDLPRNLVPVAVTFCALYAANVAMVEGVVCLQTRRRPFQSWLGSHGQEMQYEASLYLLGLFGAILGELYPWALVLLFGPSVVVYRALRDGMQLRHQTRETVETLADIVDMRDHYTFEHSKRVAEMARSLALELKLSSDQAEDIFVAARVHDVGKIGIKGQILLKDGKLTEDEWKEMRTHPEVGALLVGNLPEFRNGREMILAHHERYDGTGYPRRLSGAAIPLGARVMTVVDAFDAMTSHRSYRRAQPREYVLDQLRLGRGTQFDPAIVDVFIDMVTAGAHAPDYWRQDTREHGHEHDHSEVPPALPLGRAVSPA